jgi:cytochrome c
MMRLAARMVMASLGLIAVLSLRSEDGGKRGEQLFNRMCTGCHALDADKEGPRLRGVYGRAAGSIEGFPYSDAVRKSRLVWDESTLDKWLTDTTSVAPGNDMAFRLEKAEQRADIIAYLRTLDRK